MVQQQTVERVKQRSPVIDALAGAVAGAVSRFAIGPLDVLKIRFQVQIEPVRLDQASVSTAVASKYTGLKQAALSILKEEGIPVSQDTSKKNPSQRYKGQASTPALK